ncbi:hypothetical protein NQZ79_g5143 [Umbelopsis isabellina]|nr:hypothetical protein NQZ79_g5143 [Umbelopsis isabellina]
MSNSNIIEEPIQDAVPESFILRSRARQEKLKQAAAERKARVNCDSDDNTETRKSQNSKYKAKEHDDTMHNRQISSKFSPAKNDASKAKSLKKSRSMPSSMLKPKHEVYPPSPPNLRPSEGDDIIKVAPVVNEEGKRPNFIMSIACQSNLSAAVHLKKGSASASLRQTAPSPIIQIQERATYDSIEEQLINIYGESKWVRQDSLRSDIPYENNSYDMRSRSQEIPQMLCRSRPKVQYEHFLSPTLPLLHRFTYSQINTLSRKESELIKLYQSDTETTPLPVRRYAEDLEPILRQKIGLLIVLYEAVRDVVSASAEEELVDLACGDNIQKQWPESNSTGML